VMVFAGMLPWSLFSSILAEASNSIVGNSNLIGKVYFPRIIIPASSAVTALVDFGINLVMLAALMMWYAFVPSWRVLLLPAFVTLAVLASLGPALLLTALNVKYRDFRYIIPFIVHLAKRGSRCVPCALSDQRRCPPPFRPASSSSLIIFRIKSKRVMSRRMIATERLKSPELLRRPIGKEVLKLESVGQFLVISSQHRH